jgi:condensin complex subunit 3
LNSQASGIWPTYCIIKLTHSDEYWTSLTPEKAFLARVFVDHCIAQKDENRLEETLPVVTALAFRIQDEYNSLVSATNDENGEIAEQAFIVGELLRLALNLDYADEIGRRKMFQLARMSDSFLID